MAAPAFDTLLAFKRDISQSNDPRVGSARNNGSNPTLGGLTSGSNSSSLAQLFATLVPVTIYTTICVTIFLILRRKYPRVYSPRTFLTSLDPHERTPELPNGWFNWIKPFVKMHDTYVLDHSSLDGFLFLRFLKILCLICLVGCCITWPILIPLHACGGAGTHQLDRITFGNVTNPKWYYVHILVAFTYFGFILYMVSRECIYYINLRQAYLLSPYYANRLSSRTVLFTCVPQRYLDERKLRRVFGKSVKNVWIPRDTDDLENMVKERDQTALRLEKAEIVLIKKANVARNKAVKQGHPDIEAYPRSSVAESTKGTDNSPDPPSSLSQTDSITPVSPEMKTNHGFGTDGPPWEINGSVASQWISHSSRPHHRPIANYGRRVDTIKWTRLRLKKLKPRINKLRRQQRSGEGPPVPAVFIEFETQVDAQSAYQSLSHHRPLHMSPRYIGVRPFEIVWWSLRMKWWERIIRRFSIQAAITAMIIFWSIPSALVGTISNIKFLTTKVPFLGWINSLPSPILGLLTGLVPAIALSLLMAMVPMIMRGCARIAGVPSLSMIELFTQSAYFGFQVIQVFLVTTLTSAASAAFTDILADPASAKGLLSENLPKASNFYISYFLLQGLAVSASGIVHLPGLFRHQILARFNKNPRMMYNRWHKLKRVHWGSVFPVFTNMAVIAISYSCIAPVILGFAGVGLFVVYVVYRYNLMYVYDSEIDTKGLVYPRALMHMLIGLYLAEICLIGLFAIRGAYGPVFMMLLFFIFSGLVHVSLNEAVGPLLYNLPKTLAVEEEDLQMSNEGWSRNENTAADSTEGPANDVGTITVTSYGDEEEEEEEFMNNPNQETTRAIEGAPATLKSVSAFLQAQAEKKLTSNIDIQAVTTHLNFWTRWISPDPTVKPNFLLKWLHPEIYSDYTVLRHMVADDLPPHPAYPDESAVRDIYYPPAMFMPAPSLWIPRDPAGVSAQEVAHSKKWVDMSDEAANIDKDGKMVVDLGLIRGPVRLDRIRY